MFSSGRGLCNAGWTLSAVFCFAASAFAQKPMMAVDKNLPLSAEQTAQAIGILPLFARIKELTASPRPPSGCSGRNCLYPHHGTERCLRRQSLP
jgi:hypothetical protein